MRTLSFVVEHHAIAELGVLHPLPNPTEGEKLTLIAVGGYGRGEMAPFSDNDLLFLTPYKITAWAESVIETMLYMLWDLKLKVGHSSRTVKDCLRMGGEDFTIRTAMLEAADEVYARISDSHSRARVYGRIGAAHWYRGDAGGVQEAYAEALRRRREVGDRMLEEHGNVFRFGAQGPDFFQYGCDQIRDPGRDLRGQGRFKGVEILGFDTDDGALEMAPGRAALRQTLPEPPGARAVAVGERRERVTVEQIDADEKQAETRERLTEGRAVPSANV